LLRKSDAAEHEAVETLDSLLRVDPVQHEVVLDRGARFLRLPPAGASLHVEFDGRRPKIHIPRHSRGRSKMIKSMAHQIFDFCASAVPTSVRAGYHFREKHGSFPRIRHPETFSEMVQHRKVYNRDMRLPRLADKILVKDFVRETLGPNWIIPTLWQGYELPPKEERTWQVPFVLKVNNASNANVFVRSEQDLDWCRIEATCKAHLKKKHGMQAGEWLYSAIKPQLLVEPFIGSFKALPVDYKLWTFHGRVELIQVDTDRETGHKRCFYDRDWKKQNFGLHFPLETRDIERPASLEEMIGGAERLCQEIDFARVDLYELIGKPLFGEITFYPGSGYEVFTEPQIDQILGDLWKGKDERRLIIG
jgi:hypothetical protein